MTKFVLVSEYLELPFDICNLPVLEDVTEHAS
jgi:hypothetical protein